MVIQDYRFKVEDYHFREPVDNGPIKISQGREIAMPARKRSGRAPARENSTLNRWYVYHIYTEA